MPRINLHNKKKRTAKKTLLIFVEGFDEKVFLEYLKSLYARNSGIFVTIRNGKGGDQTSMVKNAWNELGDFGKRIVVLDADKSKKEMGNAQLEADRRKIMIIQNKPCLEGTLLSIFRENKDFSQKSSKWCKNEFEKCYLDRRKRDDISEYGKIFPKSLLDKKCSSVSVLDQIIHLIKNG